MMHRHIESWLHAELRGRVPWRWLPIAALLGAALTYALHHAPPFEDHGFLIALTIVGSGAGLAVAAGLMARPADRELPIVITAEGADVHVRAATHEDLGFCAALHAATLEAGFFTSLGHGFLRAYYATFIASPHAVARVATVRGTPIGMVVGATDSAAHSRWVLRRRGPRIASRAAVHLAFRPRTAARFVRTRVARYRQAWRRAHGSQTLASTPRASPAVLSHVAVLPGGQGSGVGTMLVSAFLEAARDAGADRVVLVTLAGDGGAASFYRRLGWTETGSRRTYDGAPTLEFSAAIWRKGS
jgi:ribosomal protein S18 acetylase RimI-like enzyme